MKKIDAQAGLTVSVIIPVYNESQRLSRTLDSIIKHTTREIEIIVVDNGSTDNTLELIETYVTEFEYIHQVFEHRVRTSYAARNAGVERATGDVLVFLDSDQLVTEGWVTNGVERMQGTGISYIAPSIELETPGDPTLISQYNKISGFPVREFIEEHHYAPTSCLFVRRSLIEAVGGFDERLTSGGDLEFGNRAYDAGYELHYAPEVTIIHPTRDSAREMIRRNIRIGRGHCQLQYFYPERYGRVGVPPRPTGIRQRQYDGSMNRVLYTIIATVMTASRGIGYYLQATSYGVDQLKRVTRSGSP